MRNQVESNNLGPGHQAFEKQSLLETNLFDLTENIAAHLIKRKHKFTTLTILTRLGQHFYFSQKN